jgi:uncharacterized protein YndB with AHSA1/START domain
MEPVGQLPVFVSELVIRATPEQVWRAITDPAFTRRWAHNTRIESTFEPGAWIGYRDDEGVRVQGEVIEAIPPRRLVMTWAFTDAPHAADPPSRVTWDISPSEGGTGSRVRVTHDSFGGPTASYHSAAGAQGWPYLLDGLQRLLASGSVAG